jgi:predicted RNA-binding Zn-ribbon protein involved in translation (DUF1610 family)
MKRTAMETCPKCGFGVLENVKYAKKHSWHCPVVHLEDLVCDFDSELDDGEHLHMSCNVCGYSKTTRCADART